MGMVSIGVYGIMIEAGLQTINSLIGAIRASSQMISYELANGIISIAIIMMKQFSRQSD